MTFVIGQRVMVTSAVGVLGLKNQEGKIIRIVSGGCDIQFYNYIEGWKHTYKGELHKNMYWVQNGQIRPVYQSWKEIMEEDQ